MKNWKIFVIFTCLLIPIFGSYQSADAQENLAQQVYAIFERNCLNCHGEHGAFTEEIIIEHTALIETGAVVPGKPIESELYKRLRTNDPAKRMPLGQPQLPTAAILTIGNWIQAGAPDWQPPERDTAFITSTEMLETIERHLNSLSSFDRTFTRYFTLTHLYNAGESPEALHAYQRALSKLVNSLSWGRDIKPPHPIDATETIFYIDLRNYEWEIGTNRWTQIEAEYPYKIGFNASTQTALREKLANLQEKMECEVPFIHVDWFIATASLPPLYHDILDLPETDRELEARLEVNVVENIRNAAGLRVWRAGFNDSGVSNHNRVVERHRSRYGAYWKSYDFAGSVGTQNIFTHPLAFTHDGGEIIFNLPNGLQAYYLADAAGNRLDAAPINIVSNPAASDPTVRNGLSCIGCHTEGMKTFEDQVRGVVEGNANPPYDKARALRLYTEKETMDAFIDEDTERYRQALEATGDVFGGIEPVQRFHEAFQRPLSVSDAAASVGLETVDFLQKVRENTSLKNLGLGVLTGANGSVKRDTWTSNFSEIVFALDFPSQSVGVDIDPQTEVIPGASIQIPDPKLRAAIEEALGKASGDIITTSEMETLEEFSASGSEIENLEGLQFATNLEDLNIWSTSVSNLSPLAGLTKLSHLRFTGAPASDLSPLSELTNLRTLILYDIGPSGLDAALLDISPLAGLTELRTLWLFWNSIADISPLAGLTNLSHLDLKGNRVSDLSPLSGLKNLQTLNLSGMSYQITPKIWRVGLVPPILTLFDISPLAGLTKLRDLHLEWNKITDVSPLANLQNLTTLNLEGNKITNVSPLANLQNLGRLHIEGNNISDISPLDELRKNTHVVWFGNPCFPQGGPIVEGPWLWAVVPGEGFRDGTDLLSVTSDGAVTELKIATNGATEGDPVGEHVWISHKVVPRYVENDKYYGGSGYNEEHRRMVNALKIPSGKAGAVYGSATLYSPREQQINMFASSSSHHKVWLNGELVRDYFQVSQMSLRGGDGRYEDFFPVTLKRGRNVLLVAISTGSRGYFTSDFGFEPDTEYTLSNPGVAYAFSQDNIHMGNTFTLDISAKDVIDLAGWQFDIAFDPAVLEAVAVNEGDFLKTEGGSTFFQKGTIDNRSGKITRLSSALLSGGGITGTGTLLSIQFSAKAGGETQLTLQNVQFGTSTGSLISAGPHEVTLVIEGQLATGDVNRDGQVSILDMILIAQQLGKKVPLHSPVDVNGDGTISILDLILVAQHLGESTAAAAPSMLAMEDIEGLDPTMIQAWIERAQVENDGSLAFQQGIAYLQSLLASLIPEKTALLPNYPNPFNPETWIPYQLSEPAKVTLRIYAVNGELVRTLALGHTPAGIYQNRSRAAYWDGKNDVGEPVASGLYFYTLTAGDFTATRKLLIRK